MAQHDYVIDNSTGANVRADINNALLAISSTNSGSSAPSTTYAFQLFANTTTSKLQIRNAANSAFVDLIGLDGTILLADGSVSSPSLAFSDDLNTGIFSSAADTFNVATGGVERMELGTTTIFNEGGADVDFRIEGDTEANLFYVDAGNERIGIHTATPSDLVHILDNGADATIRLESTNSGGDARIKMIANSSGKSEIMLGDNDDSDIGLILYDHSNNNLSFNTGATERMRLDNSGQLLLGHSGSSQLAGILAQVNIETTASASLTVKRNSANEFDAVIGLGKTRATSVGGSTIVQQNDRLGTISFFGSDGNDTGSQAAAIRAECDGTPGADDMPGRLVFMTTSDGANGSTERMRIDSSGRLLIGTTTEGHASADNLTINDSGNSGITIRSGSSDVGTILFSDATSGDGEFAGYVDYAHNDNRMTFGTVGAERMRIDSSGNVFVGKTSSSIGTIGCELNANGLGIFARSGLAPLILNRGTNDGTIISLNRSGTEVGTVAVTSSNASFNTSVSDRSLKKNFEDWTENTLNLFKNIKPQKFNFIVEEDTKAKTKGYIAQDLVDSFPEAYPKGDNGKYMFNPLGMVVYLMKAIQELEAKVAALEAT